VSNKLRIGVFQRYQMKCKSVSKKSPRYTLPDPDGHFPGHPMRPEGWPGKRRFYRGAGSDSGTTAIFYPPHQMPSAHWRAYPLRIPDDRYPEWHPTSI
ncbi:hypothetical protein BL544_22920, partial [Shigella sonnei]|nr:hypothetical protein [Shigella sonnei]